MPNLIDLRNKKFGRLSVLHRGEGKHTCAYWVCKCDCGNITTVAGSSLNKGHTKSCGCLRTDTNKKKKYTQSNAHLKKHGHCPRGKKSPEYISWAAMKSRCLNKNDPGYKNYGGRGIKVHQPWVDSFESFYNDMGPRPNTQFSLDRINPNGNYIPKNCRWADAKTQLQNKRNNVKITYKGRTETIAEWSRITGISYKAIQTRNRKGWTPEKTLTHPVKINNIPQK